ncbi:hypothetical protein NHQ30_008309 [Ciborinia camelliae]|nr:hypothetical protein NHQ30_008309 [Ciborinia camelliae]
MVRHYPLPTPHFLRPILAASTQQPRPPPLAALIATTKHRILSTSLTTPSFLSRDQTPILPPNLRNPLVPESRLDRDIPVQVLDIQDIGRSKSELLLELLREKVGERISGREVIRVVDEIAAPHLDLGSSASTQHAHVSAPPGSRGPFKLLLQDRAGASIDAFTPHPMQMQKIGFPPVMYVGCKIILRRGTRVCRVWSGWRRTRVSCWGGRVESLERGWREGLEERVRREVEGLRDG